MTAYATIARAIEAAGMVPRGGFLAHDDDGVPPLPDGRPACAVILAGDVGGRMWPAFAAARMHLPADDPLDAWTRAVLTDVAERTGAMAVFPFGGPPYWPFQRWARRAEPVAPSPIGILIHPDWGLWHAYRGALVFGDGVDLPTPDNRPSPCETCAGKPCLTTCPVGAFTGAAYRVEVCVDHVRSAAGRDCAEQGCRARRACPVGRDHTHQPEQAAFHMAAFVRAQARRRA